MNVSPKVLLVTPPFTQLNTPYPAMMYLKGFLNTKGVDSVQVDLSLEVILEIFSSRGLHELFQQVAAREIRSWLSCKEGTGRWLTRFANLVFYPGQVVSSKGKIRNGPSG